jgi:hypothetical protein
MDCESFAFFLFDFMNSANVIGSEVLVEQYIYTLSGASNEIVPEFIPFRV